MCVSSKQHWEFAALFIMTLVYIFHRFILLRRTIDNVEFQRLREEQRLLVSFDMFPRMLIQLLDCCTLVSPSMDSTNRCKPVPSAPHDEAHDIRCALHGNVRDGAGGSNEALELRLLQQRSDAYNEEGFFLSNAVNGQNIDAGVSRISTSNGQQPTQRGRPSVSPDECVTSQSGSLIALLVCDCDDVADAARSQSGECCRDSQAAALPSVDFKESTSKSLCTSNHSNSKGNGVAKCRQVRTAMLSLIEMNHFKELTHLCLEFYSATSEEVQEHLATRLEHWMVRRSQKTLVWQVSTVF